MSGQRDHFLAKSLESLQENIRPSRTGCNSQLYSGGSRAAPGGYRLSAGPVAHDLALVLAGWIIIGHGRRFLRDS